MIRKKESWTFEGRKITEKDDWDFDVCLPEDADLIARTPSLKPVNASKCFGCEVILSTRGEFSWRGERHAKVPDSEVFFPRNNGRTDEREAKYKALVKRYPSESYAEQITRREAFEIIVRFWLPREFHSDAEKLLQEKAAAHRRPGAQAVP